MVYKDIHNQNSSIGIFRLSKEGNILHANPAFINLLGFTKLEEVIGKNANEFIVGGEEKGLELVEIIKEKGKISRHKVELLTSQSEKTFISLSGNIVNWEGEALFFDGTIEDCSAVLEIEPDNIKALIRRAQAFEGVERYRFALQDCKTVLQMPYEKVGKSNYDICNMMQHRLNRTVQQLKRMA